MDRLSLGAAARGWGSPGGGDVLIGGIPLYDGLPGRIRVVEGMGRRRRSVRWWSMSWRGRWLPEVLHWSELFVVMVPTVIGVLVMLPRTRSVEG